MNCVTLSKIVLSNCCSALERNRRGIAGAIAIGVGMGVTCAPAWSVDAIEPEAGKILQAMSAYVGGLKQFSADYDVDNEIIDKAGRKIQFSASGSVVAARPGKLHITRKGPFADAVVTFDGKTVTLYGKAANVYGQIESPGPTIDEAVEEVREATGLDIAGGDLLSSDPYAKLTSETSEGVVVGTAYVSGVECDHLAFRSDDVDWQIWVEKGDQPLPLKYVITTKWVTGAPQYSIRLTNWNVDPQIDDKMFEFTPPADAKKLSEIAADETGELILEDGQ